MRQTGQIVPKLLKTADLAEYFNVHRSTVPCIMARLKVKPVRLGTRSVRWDERDVQKAIERMKG